VPKKRRIAADAAERRRQILDAARDVFARRGYHAATIDDIVAATGVARGTFYLYFDDKRAVFEALIDGFSARIAMAVVIGLSIFDNAQYILLARDPARLNSLSWIADAEEVEAALEWMNTHLENEGVIASTNPALVYLRTGRTAVAFDDPPNDWKSWRRRGVRYVACLFPLDLPASSNGGYKVLYRSPGRLWVIEI